MSNQLDALKALTTVVADSGDFESFKDLKPQDATTNPSLIFKAAAQPEYQALFDKALDTARAQSKDLEEQVKISLDQLAVNFGVEILKIIPGRVSTEIDARLSYNTQGSIDKAMQLFKMYEAAGVDPKKRVLFKLASTWEGIKAAEHLEKQGIHTNMTLMFGFCQAVASAEVGATLVSPFVGRILDFWKKETGKTYTAEEDPGVLSVRSIYNYYKKYGYKTIVMGASFRSKEEILALAGCDYLTIAPKWLKAMAECTEPVPRHLSVEEAKKTSVEKMTFDEASFRWALGEDACATTKLAEGIRNFAKDTVKLEAIIRERLQ
eukprot:CAMPEP_0168523902 /NCGR_PEP_ID=MMETSP0405-20121227/10289_1 /TAXON_ID=498012 /ORGANISM="Trichosphaerium sp, Strain Am-I-7 wt" /LENGTH=320 /DNA_ID=CAMNT_0008545923 /DNA_START=34 /DNA_END=993 /DNA_ORIENTATION=-